MRKETLVKLEKFKKECSENLSGVIDEILKARKDKKVRTIGFITTDDCYGFYLTWNVATAILMSITIGNRGYILTFFTNLSQRL